MRTNGILMPIFSLPSPHGIGTLGDAAYKFVDFLAEAGQSYWQILPLNPTSYGDSPYQSASTYAGNPYFIDLDLLVRDGLLTEDEIAFFHFGDDPLRVDYGRLYTGRLKLLSLAHARFDGGEEYDEFCAAEAWWLDDYALFMALKNANGDESFDTWDEALIKRRAAAMREAREKYARECDFYKFLQYLFFTQWVSLKEYANDAGIKIVGDIPIYVAYDSADVWADPSQFQLGEDLKPTLVAGCPPDAFSEDGQLWGNPLYDWKNMKGDGYAWWKRRLGAALRLYDVVRIDHFRGFEAYYAIPYGAKDAKVGEWKKGPNMELFRELAREFGEDLPIIAEDLGFLTPEVLTMLRESGFPGMKVLQFAFDTREESDYLPHNYKNNCVVYTGTHDNDTILGWTETASPADVEVARRYMRVADGEGFNWAMMRTAMMSVADTCILMMQDLVALGSEARINTPSTIGGNWKWRIDASCINSWLANILYENTRLYGRLSACAKAREAEKLTEKEKSEE